MSDPISRRKAITGAVVGGAVVWAAPSVVSVSAASAATVEPGLNVVVNPSFELTLPGADPTPWIFTLPG